MVTFHFYSSIISYIIKTIYISLINKIKICGVIQKELIVQSSLSKIYFTIPTQKDNNVDRVCSKVCLEALSINITFFG